MRFLYSLLISLLAPALLLRAYWRGRRSRAGLPAGTTAPERPGERLGFVPPAGDRPLLVHCVSVGETMAAAPLVSALLARGEPLWLTSTTLTGAARVQAMYAGRVRHSFLPLDTPGAVARFLDRVNPRALLVMETEVWPNLLAACARRGIPAVLVNARMSEKSARGYARAGGLARDAFGAFAAVAAQAEADAGRLRALGASRVEVTGNLKFDLAADAGASSRAAALRADWCGRPVWMAASTHAADEEVVLAAHRLLRASIPDLLLVLVPRHPERFDAVADAVAAAGFSCARRSRGTDVAPTTMVYLGDTMGELGTLYATADVAFVGGSFSGTGGHNFVEPAALGLPLACGPSVYNFQSIADALVAAGALRRAPDAAGLAAVVQAWIEDPAQRARAGAAGRAVVEANRGALQRTVALVDSVIAAPR